ncbi:MAG TPA: glutamate--tRNA ligase family protein, partial [Actinomycetes bacterium]|nr:glutamate--tRNA ligase family protein [Actinomycetes bacterium]
MLAVTNTLTRAKEPVRPHTPGRVAMYSCGPTVYRYAHVGNLRTFLLADLVRRALEAGGAEVRQVQNITDVGHMTNEQFDRGEDRMLVSARLEDKTPAEIADHYTEAFLRDVAALNLRPAAAYPRASDFVPQMLELVAKLLERGHAYEVEGTVYFAVESFPGYGRLSRNTL